MKSILITAVLFSFALTVTAQQTDRGNREQRGGTPEERANRMTDRMKTEFNLTDAQIVLVDSINIAYEIEIQKIRQDTTLEREDRYAIMSPIREKRNAALKGILTEEQYKIFIEEMQRYRGRRGGDSNNQ